MSTIPCHKLRMEKPDGKSPITDTRIKLPVVFQRSRLALLEMVTLPVLASAALTWELTELQNRLHVERTQRKVRPQVHKGARIVSCLLA